MRKNLILFIVLMTTGCGTAGTQTALNVEKSVRTTIVMVSSSVEPLVCDPSSRKMMGNAPCIKLLDVMEPVIDLAINYNRSLAEGRTPEIAKMVAGIAELISAVKDILPDSSAKAQAIRDLGVAQTMAQGGK